MTGASWDRRLAAALAGYGVLALMAGLTLDGSLRLLVWLILGALALRTWLAWRTTRR